MSEAAARSGQAESARSRRGSYIARIHRTRRGSTPLFTARLLGKRSEHSTGVTVRATTRDAPRETT